MADITKCHGTGCPLKEGCFRFYAVGDPRWQSYFAQVPYNQVTKSCDHLLVESVTTDKQIKEKTNGQ